MPRQQTICSAGKPGTVLGVDAARLRAVAAARVVAEVETLPLAAARCRVAAGPAVAAVALPPFDNAAMDGYAFASRALAGPGPWSLPVSLRIVAGDTARHSLPEGTAARIMTGAPLPDGADAVVMHERIRRSGERIEITDRPALGLNIRRLGEDCTVGDVLLPDGALLTPQRLALLAGAGLPQVAVRRKLRVGLLSTGNELRDPGSRLHHGQIYNSNRVMLAAAMSDPWLDLVDHGILPDDPEAIRAALRALSATCDVIVSSGGVSAGEEDHVLDALAREAAELEVLKVAIRPGKPLTVGRIGGALFFGLPGNPYAAFVTFTQIARPALRRASGLTEIPDDWLAGIADFDLDRVTGRREYLPVTWDRRDALGRPLLRLISRGASARLSPISLARGIAMIDEGAGSVRKGMPLPVEPLPC
ncbi:MAG: gephyrin-like molybdotransferase Glp [Gemmobacter sp.]